MISAHEKAADETAGVAYVVEAKGLSAIHDADCAAAIWHRAPTGFRTWIDMLEPECLPKGRIVLRPEDVRAAVAQICDASGTPCGRERDMLVDDIATLADIFHAIMPSPFLRVRLSAIANDACSRFHKDAVTARLICTYRGPGSQYGNSHDGSDPRTVCDVPNDAPILLRGKRWPERRTSRLLHRSPPIAGTGTTRLVLVLDPITDLSEET